MPWFTSHGKTCGYPNNLTVLSYAVSYKDFILLGKDFAYVIVFIVWGQRLKCDDADNDS